MEGTVQPGSIVVGIDSSSAGLAALDWAADHARRTRLPLHLITAYSPELAEVAWGEGSTYDTVRAAGDQLLSRARSRVALRDKTIQVSTAHPESFPAAPLIRASERAEMVVLGSHTDSMAHFGSLGATALHVASHGHCPVVVVRTEHAPGTFGRVTVGVDREDDASLAWAFREAELLEAELLCVHAWQPRDARDPGLAGDASWSDYARRCAEVIGSRIESHQKAHPQVKVRTEISQGNPARTLVHESHSSDVLVVGPRGSGGFPGLTLGHVAHSVLAHAGCAVAVAR
ncbi:universal stress protein [Luteipulveratus sp. YIM 133132]|uniref:Universal stress protein n=1 Tax=Luteipulveratus flavus TaxID=3031728 RepID=A0ABT6C5P0_9MICO|nr:MULTISPECIES: universal stress protein [unclassified Luteipulveratus]MDE9366467.1 universal stress protein [Luteipulveratus sp. YIM 133132]MDF8264259.1 universal stress protein [Luteipulveratus sp. YIM 133296]